jgi:hypothetical protein
MIHNPLNTGVFDLITEVIPDPAAGANFTWACPGNARVQILSLDFQVVVANAGAPRLALVYLATGGITEFHTAPGALLPIAATSDVHLAVGIPALDYIATHAITSGPLPDNMFQVYGHTLYSSLLTINGADQLQNIFICYKQWITD